MRQHSLKNAPTEPPIPAWNTNANEIINAPTQMTNEQARYRGLHHNNYAEIPDNCLVDPTHRAMLGP